ncbi:hypothetical protein Vretimale_16136, partial [Volvox reticuliferus]
GILAAHISASPSRTIALDGTSLLSAVVAAAATDKCGASNATLNLSAVNALLTHGSLLYRAVTSSLSVGDDEGNDDGLVSELLALPLEALSTAARVSYILQTKAPAALGTSASNVEAVQQLIADWTVLLAAAPVNLAGMAAELGLDPAVPSAGSLRLDVRAAGVLTQCQVWLRNPYMANTTSASTDSSGVAYVSGVCGPMVAVPAGCRDGALSADGQDARSNLPMTALLPFPLASAVIDPAATLASAAFLRNASTAMARPRHITPTDYALPYMYFGVGRPGAADALPANTDFVRQEWPRGELLDARVFMVNSRLLSVLCLATEFMLGLLGGSTNTSTNASYHAGIGTSTSSSSSSTWGQEEGSPRNQVVAALTSQMAADLLTGSLRLEEEAYLQGLMRVVYERVYGSLTRTSRRALQQQQQQQQQQEPSMLGSEQLEALMAAAALIVSKGI